MSYRPYNNQNDVIYACRPWNKVEPVGWSTSPPPPKPRLSKAQTDRRRAMPVPSSSLKSHHGQRCPYCGFIMIAKGHALDRGMRYPTRDHVVPKCDGGTAVLIVCAACNNEKGNMPPDLFLERRTGCRRTLARLAMVKALRKEL